jgi:predicted dehydrogenase
MIKVGILGCGRIAERHLLAYKKMPGLEVVISDVSLVAARKLGNQTKTAVLDSPAAMLEIRDLDAIDVCVPTQWHKDSVLKALNLGKHVFCEKPLCPILDDALEVESAASRANRIVMVGHLYRFHPAFEFVKEVLEAGIIGQPYFAIFRLGGRGAHVLWKHQREQGGGATMEMLVHTLDLISWYFGPIRDVSLSVREQLLSHRMIAGKSEQVDAEDLVLLKLSADGVEIISEADLLTPSYMNTVEIHGDNGSVFTSILHYLPTLVFCKEERGVFAQGNNIYNFQQENLFEKELRHFVTAIKNGGGHTNSVKDSIEVLKVLEKIRHREGRSASAIDNGNSASTRSANDVR